MTRFFVPGLPAPQGSKSYMGQSRSGRAILIESSRKVKPWREAVAGTAMLQRLPVVDGATCVKLTFVMPRPRRTPKSVVHVPKRPDLDKLVRSTLDGLSGIAFVDDNRVAELHAMKRYVVDGESTGAWVEVFPAM